MRFCVWILVRRLIVDRSKTSMLTREPTPNTSDQLEHDCRQAVSRLRGALIDLYSAAGADPLVPQEVSRRFGLNKNLTWKISRIVGAQDALTAIQHIPRAAGLEILLEALGAHGASKAVADAVRSAAAEFDATVERHAGDRANLDLILDSMGASGSEDAMEISRELAFRGNSGVWGVQATARVTLAVVVPSAHDKGMVDAALVGGLVGFRRLRPQVRWPLCRFQSYSDDAQRVANIMREPVDKDSDSPGTIPGLMRRFCTANLPPIEAVSTSNFNDYVLAPGPVGNLHAFDCFFGNISRGAPAYRRPGDEYAEFASLMSLPFEHVLFDVLIQNDVPMESEPQALVYGRPTGEMDIPAAKQSEQTLPIGQSCMEMVGMPAVVATPLVPQYAGLVSHVCERMGHDIRGFRGWRLMMKYPPMLSTVAIRWRLAQR